MLSVSWVTGGGTGIGRALAQALYRRGARVAISGRRPEALETAAREIKSAEKDAGGEVVAFPCDVSDPTDVQRVVAAIDGKWGPVTQLFNNAGSNSNRSVNEAPLDDYETMWKINCLGAITCAQSVLPAMLRRGEGAIVNVSSVLGLFASSGSASYSVSKYALAGYSTALRQGIAGRGVHVLTVYPGFIKTAMTLPFVKPNSFKERWGATPTAMANAILSALDRRKAELFFPWYVPWAVRLHRAFPTLADRLAVRVRHRNERLQ